MGKEKSIQNMIREEKDATIIVAHSLVECPPFLVLTHHQFLAFNELGNLRSQISSILEILFFLQHFIVITKEDVSLEHNGEACRISELVGSQSIAVKIQTRKRERISE